MPSAVATNPAEDVQVVPSMSIAEAVIVIWVAAGTPVTPMSTGSSISVSAGSMWNATVSAGAEPGAEVVSLCCTGGPDDGVSDPAEEVQPARTATTMAPMTTLCPACQHPMDRACG